MFGIGGFELFLILLFGFLLFGPDKLPAMAKAIGRGIAKFRAAQQDMSDVLKESNVFDPNADEPFKDPTETIDKLATTAEKHIRDVGSSAKTAVKSKTHDGVEPVKPSAKKAEAASSPSASATATPAATAKPAAAAKPASTPQQESFTERKARYERERKAKLAAQQREEAAAASNASEGGDE